MLGGALSIVIVAAFGIPSVWTFSGFVYIAGAFAILLLGQEKFRRKSVDIFKSFAQTITQAKQGLEYAGHHPVILMYMIGMFFVLFANAMNFVWQPMLVEVGMTPASLGILIMMMGFTGMIFPFFSKKFLQMFKGNEKNAIIFGNIALTICVIFFAFIGAPWHGILLFIIANALVDSVTPIEEKFTQSFIPSTMRATVGSIIIMASSLSFIIMSFLNGFVIDAIGLRATPLVFGSIAFIGVIFLFMMKPEGQKIHV
jgi:predicted MFS family arabinose efflux permease